MPNDVTDKPESMDEFGDEVRKVLMEFREKRMLAKIARDIKIQPGRLTEMITRDDNREWKRKITPYYITKLVDGGYMTVEQILRGRKLEELPEGHKTFFQRAMLSKKNPETVFLTDLCVMLKILSSEYQLYACGKIFRMP